MAFQVRYRYVNVNVGSSLTVRSQPNANASAVGSPGLARNTRVRVVGVSACGLWYQINSPRNGWVRNSFLSVNPVGMPTTPPTQAPPPTNPPTQAPPITPGPGGFPRVGWVNVDSTLMRGSANATSRAEGSLSRYAEVTIIGESGSWWRLSDATRRRYVSKNHITFNEPTSRPFTPMTNVELIDHAEAHRIGSGARRPVNVLDLWTGEDFYIQWQVPSGWHTDWTPVSAYDTEAIQRILHPNGGVNWHNVNSWSWTPRPGVITVGNRRIAVGFHLRPHGSLQTSNPNPGLFINDSDTPPGERNPRLSEWPMGGHMCMHYSNSPGLTNPGNAMAREAHRMAQFRPPIPPLRPILPA